MKGLRFVGYKEDDGEPTPNLPMREATVQQLVYELMSRVEAAIVVVTPRACDATVPNSAHSWGFGDSDELIVLAEVATMEVERRLGEDDDSAECL